MGLLSRARELLSGRRRGAAARRKEAEGRLEEATALYLDPAEPNEAARVLALRADAALDSAVRLSLLTQAARVAEGESKKALELRRARLAAALLREGKLELTEMELRELAEKLGSVGDPKLAAELFARAGDSDAEARMLVQAGAIDELETVLDASERRERAAREKSELETHIRDLLAFGRRREAIEVGSKLRGGDGPLAALLAGVEQTKRLGPRGRFALGNETVDIVFGSEVVVGRAGATLPLTSPAVSREHLVIRRAAGGPEVADLGSRNGTLLRGARLGAPLPVGDAIELMLGGEVRLGVGPWSEGGVRIELGAEVLYAPLGPYLVHGWSIAPAADGWLELATDAPAFLAGLQVNGRVQICRGDAFSDSHAGAVRLRVL